MPPSRSPWRYAVTRDLTRPGYADVALVRRPASARLQRDRPDGTVLHRRTFRPQFQIVEMERYAAQLERLARHGNEGTLGAFVDVMRVGDGTVRLSLYDRWFDGRHIRCERLASRDFDASDHDAVIASSEYLAELQAWGAERDEARERSVADAAAEKEAIEGEKSDRSASAKELYEILVSRVRQRTQ